MSNWNWGGREHPKYQNLSMACKSLLGLGKLIARMVVLKPMGNTDESEKGIVGNTILVAQPAPEIIAAELPPTEEEQAQYFNVVYAAEHSNLAKKKALVIDRAQYLECAALRQAALEAQHPVAEALMRVVAQTAGQAGGWSGEWAGG